MKHLLNNISEEEKQSILEQHKGGMKVFNENFNKMVNKKLGHVELYEQSDIRIDDTTLSTKTISDLPEPIRRRAFEIGQRSSDFTSFLRQRKNNMGNLSSDAENTLLTYLMAVAQWSIGQALKNENATLDDSIKNISNPQFLSQALPKVGGNLEGGDSTKSDTRVKNSLKYFEPETLSKVIIHNYDKVLRPHLISGKSLS
jgi:hypothetical protein